MTNIRIRKRSMIHRVGGHEAWGAIRAAEVGDGSYELDKTEEVLKLYEKNYEFHRYDGAGHGFWYYDKAMYRQEQAMDSFNKVIAFFDQYLK